MYVYRPHIEIYYLIVFYCSMLQQSQ